MMRRHLGVLATSLLLLAGSIGLASAAETPTPAASAPAAQPQINPYPSVAKPGTRVQVTGTKWPAKVPIQVALCGNFALNGTSDCDGPGAGSGTTDAAGNFLVYMTANTPPKPCPCVIFVNTFASPVTAKQPFSLTGAKSTTPSTANVSRSLDASVRLSGNNLGAWVGGAAKRTFTLTLTNTGSSPITDPAVTITAGRGSDPSNVIAQPKVGTIAPGQTVQYEVPVTFKAPAFGQYRVKTQITGLDSLVEQTASTSSYPWLLIILAWLLLQPLLLGLYKRRPIAEDDEDIFAPDPDAPQPAAGAYSYDEDPLLAPYPAAEPAPVGVASGGHAAAGAAVVGTAVVARTTGALVPNYQPVFGVTDLRAYLDPGNVAASPTVAPRIVVGGVVPATAPANGHAAPSGQAPVYQEPVYAEPVYAEPVQAEPVYAEPVYAEPAYQAPPAHEDDPLTSPLYAQPAQPPVQAPQYPPTTS